MAARGILDTAVFFKGQLYEEYFIPDTPGARVIQ